MSGRVSAGILLFRLREGVLEVLIAHPGGPYAASKDLGSWSLPKGEVEADEPLEAVALREFAEETGHDLGSPALLPLGTTRQKGGKLVHAWACRGDLDPAVAVSNTFEIEWPPGSGAIAEFPEIDRVAWFEPTEARRHLKEAQGVFVDRLEEALDLAPRRTLIVLPPGTGDDGG